MHHAAARSEVQAVKAIALIVVLLAGCAAPAPDSYDVRNSWHDASYEAVVSQWGVPLRNTVLADGRYAYTWASESAAGGAWYPSFGIFGGSRGVGVGTGVGMGYGGGTLVRCERTLFFRDARVVDQTWQGPVDYCNTFRRN
jgi:hypothetical protein